MSTKLRTVWRLIVHHEDGQRALELCRDRGRIAIGWGLVGDLRANVIQDPQDIGLRIREEYPKLRNAHNGSPSLWAFARDMRRGDLVILTKPKGGGRQLVMQVTGPYRYDRHAEDAGKPPGEYWHRRRARRLGRLRPDQIWLRDPNLLWRRAGGWRSPDQSHFWALFRCAHKVRAPYSGR